MSGSKKLFLFPKPLLLSDFSSHHGLCLTARQHLSLSLSRLAQNGQVSTHATQSHTATRAWPDQIKAADGSSHPSSRGLGERRGGGGGGGGGDTAPRKGTTYQVSLLVKVVYSAPQLPRREKGRATRRRGAGGSGSGPSGSLLFAGRYTICRPGPGPGCERNRAGTPA
ncbi:hypothetical protein GGR56DRAFT_263575 [Xylariaceae sp. FL0804]|nr:hypothetical protein GGR56DRAFT_263575 [Xylariaceae sp. FL0804]